MYQLVKKVWDTGCVWDRKHFWCWTVLCGETLHTTEETIVPAQKRYLRQLSQHVLCKISAHQLTKQA